ncbi:response regulator [Thiospirochaeta perfilievii]|uniref:histidine kinase n=1 Tax=Thiospirochaeta perfilievii TaxID=252967 RepID=A0A5C1QHM7_9SPIO|nr:ATP-binding protein [Thiospirochaeta perfilievii]QEN06066.1 response regulator [Thiospirochaeta perfilievii]
MKLKSFTKTIYKSTFITSIITNVLTSSLLLLLCINLIGNIYNNKYNESKIYISDYINNINTNDEIYNKISKLETTKADNQDSYIAEINTLINNKLSFCGGVSIFFGNIDDPLIKKLKPIEYKIYKRFLNSKDYTNKIVTYNNNLYILNERTFKEHRYIQFFNINNCKSLLTLYKKDGLMGFIFNDQKFIFNGVKLESTSKTLLKKLKVKNSIEDIYVYFSTQEQYLDNLKLFIAILIFSTFRFLASILNAKRNIRKIIQPLDDLVQNTEKLAAHEVCEKLNRFDYPYDEFKKLAETFNKVLLSRELSEIKLFRSFEQMESVVHKRTQELISTNDQLTVAIKKAEEANALKSQFLANISHEIRTPLNCIMGFCDIILTEDHSESVTVQVKQILHESETLLHLINDFLDYSKIDAGKMNIVETELSIRSLINSLMKSGQVQAGDKNIILYSEIDEDVPHIIISDELRLYQIVSNIFYNAIKFTPTGSVKIKISSNMDNDENLILDILIVDTGIGIPEDRIDSIFNKFEQVDGSLTRKFRGSGLGLTICKKIIELMSGSISVESTINRGSSFNIKIPVKAQTLEKKVDETLEIQDDNIKHTEGSQILLVEDYPVNQIVAKKHLEMDNHIVTIAENGQEAIIKCEEIKFDLILMDLQMPIMDGFKATKEIRGASGLNSTTPILAMTANAMDTAKQTCLDTGMNGIITKPIRKQMFLREVDKWLKISTQ